MNRNSLLFWAIFIVAVLLSAAVIKFFFQIAKVVLFVLLLLVLTPLIYVGLRNLVMSRHHDEPDDHHKLKERE